MNEFYQEITVSFEVWMVVAPIIWAVAAGIGSTRYYRQRHRIRKNSRASKKRLKINAIILGIIFGIFFIQGSAVDIIQWFINSSPSGDSPVWALLIGIIMVLVCIGFFCEATYLASVIGAWAKYGYLVEEEEKLEAARKASVKEEIIKVNRSYPWA